MKTDVTTVSDYIAAQPARAKAKSGTRKAR